MQDLWEEMSIIVASLEKDAIKTDAGNIRAAVTLRKGLRILKERTANMLRESIQKREEFVENKKQRIETRRAKDKARELNKDTVS